MHIIFWLLWFSSVQFSSVTQSGLTLCNPMVCSIPGFPVHYQLPELTQTHVHWVSDAIHPSHPVSSPSPPTFNLSQHQGLFKWVSFSHQVAKRDSASASLLSVNIQDWLPLGWTGCCGYFYLNKPLNQNWIQDKMIILFLLVDINDYNVTLLANRMMEWAFLL